MQAVLPHHVEEVNVGHSFTDSRQLLMRLQSCILER